MMLLTYPVVVLEARTDNQKMSKIKMFLSLPLVLLQKLCLLKIQRALSVEVC